MIGLMILAVVSGYILFSKFIIDKVYKSYGTKKAKNIALAIMILIPTWDIVLGYPIYKLLCWTSAGVHIYKSVDNVEGFYIGDWRSDGYSKVPPRPYKGYRFVDYREIRGGKPTGKYFRTIWMDANETDECITGIGYPNEYNKKLAQSGKCIVKKEIPEGEVSRLEFNNDWIDEFILPGIDIKMVSSARVIKRIDKIILSELIRIVWKGGWVYGILSSIPVGNSWKIKYPTIHDVPGHTIIIKTLKPKKGEK
jgi:hypothetical protein